MHPQQIYTIATAAGRPGE